MKNALHQAFPYYKGELAVATLLFTFFFLVIGVFQMLYPLKKGLFVATFGAEVELNAKLANIVAAALAVILYTYLYNRLRRQSLIDALCGFFVIAFLVLAVALQSPGPFSIWSFYLLTDLITTVMVATFWAYATDLSSADQAKRLFGFIGTGGLLGGVAGTFVAKSLGGNIGTGGMLLLAAVVMVSVTLITRVTRIAAARSGLFLMDSASTASAPASPPKPDGSHAALEGAKLVLRSNYLLSIVGILAFYEMASQIMDFQFSRVGEQIGDVASVQAFFTDVRLYANIVSVVVQLLLVSFIMRKLGVLAALLVLPLCAIGSSLGFLVLGTVQAASLLHISDNGLNYSIQQTSRESLYTITSPDEKYKARAFTNMFMQRFAKGVSVLTSMGLVAFGVHIQDMGWLTIAVALGMIVCSVYAGHRFAGTAEHRATPKPAASLA